MKKNQLLLIIILSTISSIAQNGINYKALIKDNVGNVVANDLIVVQFGILQGTAQTNVYTETHTPTTDANGLVVLNIGTGTVVNGIFSDIDWSADDHFLNVQVNTGVGFVDLGTTIFSAVPYAKHAETASMADNVFSGDYNDLINQPTTLPSGLEQITENDGTQDNTGWRLVGRHPSVYGPIGNNAVDLSYSNSVSVAFGATGNFSTAMGFYTTASGESSRAMGDITVASGFASTAMGHYTLASGSTSTAMGGYTTASGVYSTAMGRGTNASGDYSTAIGNLTLARSFAETAIGTYNTDYTPTSSTAYNTNDRLFVIGNGTSNSNRNNALTILKNGNATFDGEIQHTTTGSANLVPIAYGSVSSDANATILGGTGNFTVTRNNSTNEYTVSVTGQTLSSSNTVASAVSNTSNFRTVNITYSGGNMIVHIFIANGTKVASPFQFTIYKL